MKEGEPQQVLGRLQAIIAGSHIVYTSGMHGKEYVNKDAVYPHVMETHEICREIADRFRINRVEVVIAPAIGGVVLSHLVAYHLSRMYERKVPALYAEKEVVVVPDPEGKGRKVFATTGGFVVGRGQDKFIPGKNVLVVEDVLTTGDTARKVIKAVCELGGNVVGLGVLCNRGGLNKEDMGVPKLESLIALFLEMWAEEDCPMCKVGMPINTDVGKGREFLEKKKQQA